MLQKRIYLIIFALLLLAGMVIGLFNSNNERATEIISPPSMAQHSPSPIPQSSEHRILKQTSVQKIFTIGSHGTYELYQPTEVELDSSGYIYIFDWGDLSVIKFSPEGKLIRKFGKGKGKGPGEFENPTDFAIGKHGEVWVCDPVSGLITVFDSTGSVKQTFRPQSLPYRIAPLSTGGCIIMPATPTEHAFETYHAGGSLQASFGSLLPDQGQYSILIDGRAANAGDAMYFAFSRSGLLLSYLMNGQVSFFVETIDRIPLPKIQVLSKGGVSGIKRVDPNAPWTALSINVADSKIYVLSWAGSVGQKGMVIDAYNRANGAYVESFLIPEKCSYSYFNEKFLYTIEDTTVTKWKVRF